MEEKILKVLEEMKSEIGGIKTEISGIKTEISGIKTEISGIKTEIGGIKSEISGIKTELKDFKSEMKSEISGMKQEISETKSMIKDTNLQVTENTKLIRILLDKAEVNKAEHDKMMMNIAQVQGDVKHIQSGISKLEVVTGQNCLEISYLKKTIHHSLT